MLTHLAFIAFVALAVYVQNLTGFAFALVLLGLVGVVDLVPLPDAANAVTALTIVNALMFFYRRRMARIEPAIVPAVAASLVGVLAGIAMLTWLAASAHHVLRMLLGVSIIACAVLLWRAVRPLPQPSGAGYFTVIGALSGILGGLFSAPGPPLAYAVYRQPWPLARMQESLIFCFAVAAVLRLIIIVASGQLSRLALLLTIEAIPVTLLVTAICATRAPPISPATVKKLVCILLVVAGAVMLV